MRTLLIALLTIVVSPAMAADAVDRATINRIVDEGFNHSELPQTAQYLTDRIGGRMTNSPQMRAAEKWTQEQFRRWNLQNVRTEAFDFGRGWSIERSEVRMTAPRVLLLRAIPVAWTPPTQGKLTAAIVVAPMKRERDFVKWKGQLRGRIVLVDRPTEGSEPADRAAFRRLSDEDLGKLDAYSQPMHSQAAIEKILKRAAFDAKRDAFLASEGALAWIRESYRDGGLLHGEGYSYAVGKTPALPGIEVAAEDYSRLARLAKPAPHRHSKSRATCAFTMKTTTPTTFSRTSPVATRRRATSWPARISTAGSLPMAHRTTERAASPSWRRRAFLRSWV